MWACVTFCPKYICLLRLATLTRAAVCFEAPQFSLSAGRLLACPRVVHRSAAGRTPEAGRRLVSRRKPRAAPTTAESSSGSLRRHSRRRRVASRLYVQPFTCCEQPPAVNRVVGRKFLRHSRRENSNCSAGPCTAVSNFRCAVIEAVRFVHHGQRHSALRISLRVYIQYTSIITGQ